MRPHAAFIIKEKTMTKTYFLGQTVRGANVGRASQNDYGYTHACVRWPEVYDKGAVIPLSAMSFSRSADGAFRNASQYRRAETTYEIVAVKIVDRADYKAVMGKA